MNTKAILAAATLMIAAGSSFAADTSEAAFDQTFLSSAKSTLTREEVKAATIAARDAGQLDTNEAYQDIAYMAPRAKSAEVKAQLAAKQQKDKTAQ
ncbi:DUF4148 domain-containing protein [Pseudoduganella sp. FT55W]|uniref:DUF4148 domain-containing protein n=1 Tax=Duganella rivi TaxID=2666083 RepID=A0A7X4GVD3_9BURK|nr:DUF4148 domain-containing protein [Duganella rivi]MYM70380.1 DUF4148 domain-containing protein [Duganella rivi]